jgi:lipopolysaccharide export system protein LptA
MRRHRLLHVIFRVLAGACFLWVTGLRADSTLQVIGNYVDSVYYGSPNEQQVKYKLYFASSDVVSGNALLKVVKIEQYAIAGGKPQLIAETPECLYDQRHSTVNSAKTLQVHAQDGRFFVEGVGFFLQISNSSLVISNNVHSILLLQTDTNAPATEIFSHRAEYLPKSETTNGLAFYEGEVRLIDPRLKLTSEYLAAELPKDQTNHINHINHIIAETNVVLDFASTNGDQIHALGQKAIYDRVMEGAVTNEILNLTGDPRINLTNGWMTADDFTVNRVTGKLHGQGHFHFHYPASILATNGSPENSGASTPSETLISSDAFDFDFNTRGAQFWGHVRVDDPRMQMTSESLAANLPPGGTGQTGRPDHILAETNVTINFLDDKSGQKVHATGQKAVYDYRVANALTNEVLELTGNPTVETAGTNRAGWMTADVITVDRAQGRIWGIGNHHSVLKQHPEEPAALDTEIFSDRFDFALPTGLSVYKGSVRAYNPEMNLTGDNLLLKLAKSATGQTNRLERAEAEGNVVIDFIQKPFDANDITNLPAFAARLSQPAPTDAIARYVSSKLSQPTRQLLMNYPSSPLVPSLSPGVKKISDDPPLRQALALDLNRLVESGALYEAGRFSNVLYLSIETTDLLSQHPLGTDLIQLNRLLLLDAFRGELTRGRAGEKIVATGDRAIYSNTIANGATNVVLQLSGHPKLARPSDVVTTDDTIIYDRTAGMARFIGRPHYHSAVDTPANVLTASGKTKK